MVEEHERLATPAGSRRPEHRPRAAILACSDARVPPSLIFGQEPGALFVVRLAGNSATAGAVASLTYAVEALETRLVVVLGHTDCGAVNAALATDQRGTAVLRPILSPIDEVLDGCADCTDPDTAVITNVRRNLARLRNDRGPLGEAIRLGSIELRGAVHDLGTGHLTDVTDAPTGASTADADAPHPNRTEPNQPLTRSTTTP